MIREIKDWGFEGLMIGTIRDLNDFESDELRNWRIGNLKY